MFDHKQLKKSISCLAWTFLFCAAAYPQQEPRQGVAQRSGTETATRAPGRPPDIISDNLERVAASADQILEVLHKEAGLMVEFKRLLAQDAGVSGQILEESDLADVAVAERLRSDLRARVLATRLLQRYGYLVPRLNPDSDLEAEQKLVREERAQMLARAAERRDTLVENSTAGRNAACDPRSVPECAFPPSPPEDRESLPVGPTAPGRGPRSSAPLQRADDTSPGPMTPPDGRVLSPDQRSGNLATLAAPETMLTAARVDTNSSLNWTPRMAGYGSGENSSLPSTSQADLQSLSVSQPDQLSSGAGMPRTGRGSERYPAGRDSSPAGNTGAEQGRMVRRPNPYADVPSLYDLYVQAGTTNRPLERFGLDVFRKGTANPDYIPMDLPVGPSYVVGPGDNLSIDLWGGVSQRLLRTVDREGRVALPETGPVLVSGRTLGDVQEMVQRTLRTQFRDVSADVALLRLRSVRMYVVGDVTSPGAYDVSSLSTPLNALFVAGGVTPQGSVSEELLAWFYTSSRCFLYPTLYEGFGFPVLEAMACGAPVIASDCTSVSEIAGDAAILVDPSSEESIGNALVRLLRDEPLRRHLIQQGRARVQKFDWQDTVQKTLGIYAELSECANGRALPERVN